MLEDGDDAFYDDDHYVNEQVKNPTLYERFTNWWNEF